MSVIPEIAARDIPIVSIGNSDTVNQVIKAGADHVYVKETDYEAMGMVVEPGVCTVKTSLDNCGDDKDTSEHKIGYVAYYNKDILESGQLTPMVFCFHGGGDSAMCMASVSGWPMVAAKYNFLLVCVEHHMNSTATETVEMLEQLIEKYPIDSERIYSTGFSMGGCKSWDLFQEYPTLLAGVAPMDATFDVGQNVFANQVNSINLDCIVPVFYVGGEKTPLPELPFQAEKCVNRMKYVLQVNQAKADYNVKYEDQEAWKDPIWGISGDYVYQLRNEDRENSILTLNLFESENGHCYSIFGCVSDQQHEVRHHSCENAWKFLSQFRRLATGTIDGGNIDDIIKLYSE